MVSSSGASPVTVIASDFDYAVAADGAVGVRAFTSGSGGAALYLAASNGEVRLVAGGGQQFLEPVGQPAFGPGGQLFFQARNPVWPRDRNGRIPVGLFQYRWGDPGPVGVAVPDQVVPGEPGQLGQLGRSVAPRLYVAVETEGDYEHAAASVKAGVIVVFKSSNAPVTGTADIAVAGDWRETLPSFVRAYTAPG